jgi:prepilin-type N-terminal cleavage/methylation domain-containing protein
VIPQFDRDEGFTLTEVIIAMAVTSVVMAALLVALVLVLRVDRNTQIETDVMTELQFTRLELEREIREANAVLAGSGKDRVRLWSDLDEDGALDTGEAISWQLEDVAGEVRLVRRTNAGDVAVGDAVLANWDTGAVLFSYNVPPPDSTAVTINLQGDADYGSGQQIREVTTEVVLRNGIGSGGT